MTVQDAVKLRGISEHRIQALCEIGKIEGTTRIGKVWAIPKTTTKPVDDQKKRLKRLTNLLGEILSVSDNRQE
jgi:hypothetical protein